MSRKIRAVSGGTGASKTVGIIIWCIDYAQSSENEIIDIVSESYPHLEAGAIREFKAIMIDRGYWIDSRWNETKHIYTFETGTILNFESIDKIGKAHGPRRDVLFVNECNYIAWNIIDQLIARTRKVVWLDWNPVSEFWFYTELQDKRQDIDFLKLTYLDNECLSESERKEIESRKERKDWWKVYGLGELGEIEGRIYTDWQIIDELPFEARLERYGLDFGWKPDPAAIVAVYFYNGGYIFDELLYQYEQRNSDLAGFLKNLPPKLVIADSAEPKSIEEIKGYGINILGADKGKDSKKWGIKILQDQKISVTKNSTNLIKEYRNYLWKMDKNGKVISGETDEKCPDHALDAARYALSELLPQQRNINLNRLRIQTKEYRPYVNPAI